MVRLQGLSEYSVEGTSLGLIDTCVLAYEVHRVGVYDFNLTFIEEKADIVAFS